MLALHLNPPCNGTVIGAMALTRTLSDRARSICPKCGAPVWMYLSPLGGPIALDNAPGDYLIDGRNKAYRPTLPDGYRVHSCGRLARTPFSGEVTSSEFLWL